MRDVRRALAERDIQTLHFVPPNGMTVSAPVGARLEGIDGIRATFALRPEDRLSAPARELAAGPTRQVPMFVEFYFDVSNAEAIDTLRSLGVAVDPQPALPGHVVHARIETPVLRRLAEQEAVTWIFPAPAVVTDAMAATYCPGPVSGNGFIANFSTSGPGWDGPGLGSAELTYYFVSTTDDVPANDQQVEIANAFHTWSKYVQVAYRQTATADEDFSVEVLFGVGNHGDAWPFPATGGPLAHNFYPAPPNPESIAGDMHFNDWYTFNIGSNWDVFSVALHEAGHGLGLGHSAYSSAVMYPFIMGVYTDLHADDVAGAESLYASGETPTVAWESLPPESVDEGDVISFSWEVAGGAPTATQVIYDTAFPPTAGLTTPSQSGSAGIYSDSIVAPAVTATTTYYFQAQATVDGVEYSSNIIAVDVQPAPGSSTAPTNLTVTSLTHPKPEFSAQHNDPEGEAADTRHIQVGRTAADVDGETNLLWDEVSTGVPFSPEVADGEQSEKFTYGGAPLSWNTTHFWRIKFWDVAGNESDWSTIASFTLAAPSATLPNLQGWQMVGIPSGSAESAGALTGTSGTFYSWDETTRDYVVASILQPGRGYFVQGSGTVTLTAGSAIFDPFSITDLDSNDYFTPVGIEISEDQWAGWHMLSNVYNESIDWDEIYDGGFTTNLEAFYTRWDGTQYVPYNAVTNTGPAGPTIDPFQAFWVHVLPLGSSGEVTLQPPAGYAGSNVPAEFDENGWLLQLSAVSGTMRDDYNWVGVHALGDDRWDIRDASEPGTLADPSVKLYIAHPDWNEYAGSYHQDVRKTPYESGAVVTWTVTVKASAAPVTVALSWPNLQEMPAEWAYTLDGIDLSGQPDFTYDQVEPFETFTLEATRQASGAGTLEVGLGTRTPQAQGFLPGATLTVLQVDLTAAAEDIQVDSIPAFPEGTASVEQIHTYHDLNADGVLQPEEPEITSVLVAEGTRESVLVVFSSVTGEPGSNVRGVLDPATVTGTGMSTGVGVSGHGGLIEGATLTMPSVGNAPPAQVSSHGGSEHSCGLGALSASGSSVLPLAVLLAVAALMLGSRRFLA